MPSIAILWKITGMCSALISNSHLYYKNILHGPSQCLQRFIHCQRWSGLREILIIKSQRSFPMHSVSVMINLCIASSCRPRWWPVPVQLFSISMLPEEGTPNGKASFEFISNLLFTLLLAQEQTDIVKKYGREACLTLYWKGPGTFVCRQRAAFHDDKISMSYSSCSSVIGRVNWNNCFNSTLAPKPFFIIDPGSCF